MKNFYVLVVDDEFRIRKLLAEFLSREGYKVLEAEDGEEALDMLFESGKKIDLVILDVMMPKYDGWYVLERIRDYMTIPVIMLTARSDEYDQLKGFKLGADDYVTKPFSPSVLVARVNKLLSKTSKDDQEINFGVIRIDLAARKTYINEDLINLTPKELLIIRELLFQEIKY